jgi:hypothetical protein
MEHIYGTVLTVAETNKILLVDNCCDIPVSLKGQLHLALCTQSYDAYINIGLEGITPFGDGFCIMPYNVAPSDGSEYAPWITYYRDIPYTGYIIGKKQANLGALNFSEEDKTYLENLTRELTTVKNRTGVKQFSHHLIQIDKGSRY